MDVGSTVNADDIDIGSNGQLGGGHAGHTVKQESERAPIYVWRK